MSARVTIRHRERYGVVPDRVLEEGRLTLSARAVAAWLCGRQDGFEIQIEAMRTIFLKISEKVWRAARKELEALDWWRSARLRDPESRGKFFWRHEFSADGDFTILPSGMDGESMDAEGQDPCIQHHEEKTTPFPPDFSLQELLEATRLELKDSAKKMGPGLQEIIKNRYLSNACNRRDISAVERHRQRLRVEREHQKRLSSVPTQCLEKATAEDVLKKKVWRKSA